MTRNLKALGLAVMAAFAMSAVFATGAQAEAGALRADIPVEEATLTGTAIKHKVDPEEEGEGTPHHRFVTGVGEITCEEILFDGTVKDNAEELTITPTYNTCTTIDPFGTQRTTTINMTNCDYVFTGGNQTKGAATHFAGITTSLKCSKVEEEPHIIVYNSTTHGSGHEVGNRRCEYTVHQFGPHLTGGSHKEGITATNTIPGGEAKDDVDVTASVPNVKFTRTFGTFLQCGSATQESTYTGGVTLRAYEDEKHEKQVNLTLVDPTPPAP